MGGEWDNFVVTQPLHHNVENKGQIGGTILMEEKLVLVEKHI